jgi:AcrR family transcriptional regulator
MLDLPTLSEDPKRTRILDGAMKVFLAYGYQRVTMDDIAREAEMSRPAVYLLFRNKMDIYRAIAARMFDLCSRQIAAMLVQDGTFGERLMRAIDGTMIEMMRPIHESPHGAELLDLKNSLAAELIESWHAAVARQFRDAIDGEAARLGVDLAARGLAADGLAEMLLDSLEGMKHRITDPATQRSAARQLVRVIELAIGG